MIWKKSKNKITDDSLYLEVSQGSIKGDIVSHFIRKKGVFCRCMLDDATNFACHRSSWQGVAASVSLRQGERRVSATVFGARL